jgi:hypothetical protein
MRMSDPRSDPHGPEQLPDRQPMPQPTDLSNQEALQTGASSRWLVPSAVLAVVSIALYVWAFSLQLLLPIIGIVYVVVMWTAMLVISRRAGDARMRNRRLAWFMGALAVGALVVFLGIYLVEILTVAQL